MTTSQWKKVLAALEVDTLMGESSPVEASALDQFETQAGVALPVSYRSYCSVFGAGELGRLVEIAVPNYPGEAVKYSLEWLQELAQDDLEYDEYSPDPAQHARSVFFANDITGAMYFFDPDDVTAPKENEYGVYRLLSDFEVYRVADDFGAFVTEVVLGGQYELLVDDEESPEQIFRPVSR